MSYNNNKKIWIISDTHFNHKFMVDKWIRPDNYQELIINNWRKYVGIYDTVIHLWDVIFSRPSELWGILDSLPGYKILVKGNHDKNADNWYMSQGFNEVHLNYLITLWIDKVIECTHKPIKTTHDINLSWHLHNYKGNNTFRHKEAINLTNKSRVYSAELEDYHPVLLEYIISEQHESAVYIRERWPLSIVRGHRLSNVKKFIGKVWRKAEALWNTRIF